MRNRESGHAVTVIEEWGSDIVACTQCGLQVRVRAGARGYSDPRHQLFADEHADIIRGQHEENHMEQMRCDWCEGAHRVSECEEFAAAGYPEKAYGLDSLAMMIEDGVL